MTRLLLFAGGLAIGAFVAGAARPVRSVEQNPSAGEPNPLVSTGAMTPPIVVVNRPDSESPSGRCTVRLSVARSVVPGRGVTEYLPVGRNDAGLVVGPDDWVISLDGATYLLTRQP